MQMAKDSNYVVLHSGFVRWTHWAWAIGIVLLIGSGFEVYNHEPLFDFYFPQYLIIGNGENTNRLHNDDGLAAALMVHFFAMWLLFLSLVVYVTYGFVSGHFRKEFLPIWPRQIIG